MYMDGVGPYSGNRNEIAGPVPYGTLAAIEAAIVRAIVRGEQPVETLKQTSLRIGARRLLRAIDDPATAFVSVTCADLAEGLLALRQDPAALIDWANFIVAIGEYLSFDHSEHGERLHAAVWDLAFGAPIDEPVTRLAAAIRSRVAKS